MSDRIDRTTFCKTYVPMARANKTALEIGVALGVEQPTNEKIAGFVSQKASNYRKELRAAALVSAKKQGLDAEATKALVEATAAKMPKLTTRTRTTEDFGAWLDSLDGLLEAADAPPEEGEEAPADESTETPS